MATTLLLCRNGMTDWSRDGRLAGRREIGMSAEGRAQAEALAERLAPFDITEVLSSPLPRAVETAELIAARHDVEAARDGRLTDLHAGRWEGMKTAEIAATEEYKRFLASPMSEEIPGGEKLTAARDRMISSVEQALADNQFGSTLLFVSHAGPLRILLAHYLGMDLATYHRLRISHASVSALRFEAERGVPRVLALNLGDPSVVLR